MAKRIVKDAVFTLATVNYDAQVESIDLDVGADEQEVTNMNSAGWKEYLAGLKSYNLTVNFKMDADLSGLDAALWTAFTAGTATAWTAKGQDAAISTSNVEMQGNVIVLKPTAGGFGSVGQALQKSITFRGTGAIVRDDTA